jgi:steroid 5-alpha reductase family enzyme
MPGVYAWAMAYMSGFAPRQTLAASLVTVWGIRLTFNFARKGGYSWKFWEGEEDYRWAIVRRNPLFKS